MCKNTFVDFEKKKQRRNFLSNVKIYYKDLVIKTVWYLKWMNKWRIVSCEFSI